MIYLTVDDFDNDEHIFEVRKDLHKKKLIREANTRELLTKCKNVLVYFFLVIFIIGFSVLYYISISQYFGYFNNIMSCKVSDT